MGEFKANISEGLDYWIWDAITVTNPRVVVIEFLAHFPSRAITVPSRDDFVGTWIPYDDAEPDLSKDETRIGPGGKLSRWSTYYGGASLAAFASRVRKVAVHSKSRCYQKAIKRLHKYGVNSKAIVSRPSHRADS